MCFCGAEIESLVAAWLRTTVCDIVVFFEIQVGFALYCNES